MTDAEKRELIRTTRDRLAQYFDARSNSDGFAINPTIRDERTTELAERLYEEESGDRQFVVYPFRNQLQGVDGFTKKIGLDFDITLLGIFAGTDEKHFHFIWDLYIKWMHERVSENVILEMADQARARARDG